MSRQQSPATHKLGTDTPSEFGIAGQAWSHDPQ
jgi:hypothetical protein